MNPMVGSLDVSLLWHLTRKIKYHGFLIPKFDGRTASTYKVRRRYKTVSKRNIKSTCPKVISSTLLRGLNILLN
jgi:hypothetical protein